MHLYYFYLHVMNLGASVTISEVAAHCRGPHQNRSPTLGSDRSMAFFGLLLDQYCIVEAEDLTCITLTVLQE